jgi:hypothetical protein
MSKGRSTEFPRDATVRKVKARYQVRQFALAWLLRIGRREEPLYGQTRKVSLKWNVMFNIVSGTE